MRELLYINQRKFYFNQFSNINLLKYEKNIKFGVRYFYLSSEKVFKNKEALKKIMPEIYFWMGFLDFAFNDFYQKLNPNFFTHQELLNKKLQEHTHVKILRTQHCINDE